MKLTVFTPAYNRANLLPRLFESVKKQKCRDFEWLIVDDGSSDDTGAVVGDFIKASDITVRYIYQENAGKPSAFNNAVKNAKGDLFFCVDSDDILADDAVETICGSWKENQDSISGIIGLKSDFSGKLLCGRIPDKLKKSSLYSLVNKYGCSGEFSLVFRTDILRNNPFPVISGEKFITECVLYDRLDMKYEMVLSDKVLTGCEYQQGGLSDNTYTVQVNNPVGYKLYYMQRLDMALSFRERFGYALRYNAFGYLGKTHEYDYAGKHKGLVRALKPFGFLLSFYYNGRR